MISLRTLAARQQHPAAQGHPSDPAALTGWQDQDPASLPPVPAGDSSAGNSAPSLAMARTRAEEKEGKKGLSSGQPLRPLKHLSLPPLATDRDAFRHGFAWLNPRIQALTTGGWTRPELYRRNRSRRGIAWLALWADKEVTPELLPGGAVKFHIRRLNRTVFQVAWPRKRYPGVATGEQ